MIVLRILASFALFLLWIPVYVIGFPMVAIGLLFCNRYDEHMPGLFWLWDNPTAGINGTIGGRNPIWPKLTGGKERTYRYRWIWLAWRNPTSGFSHWIGVPITKPVVHRERARGPFKCISNRMGPWWDYAVAVRYGKTGRGFFVRIGWKLSAYQSAGEDEKPVIAQRMFRVSPYKAL